MTDDSKRIIALCGPKNSGKTTLGTFLNRHGYRTKKFAEPLKLMLRTFLSYQGCPTAQIDQMLEGNMREEPSEYFLGKSTRHAMQTLGTEWREMIGRNLWVDAWHSAIKQWDKVVVDDLRFIHEAEAVRQYNGTIVTIMRTGSVPDQRHASEWELLEVIPDFVLINDSTPEAMFRELQLRIPNL